MLMHIISNMEWTKNVALIMGVSPQPPNPAVDAPFHNMFHDSPASDLAPQL